jgi:hypothetical protein
MLGLKIPMLRYSTKFKKKVAAGGPDVLAGAAVTTLTHPGFFTVILLTNTMAFSKFKPEQKITFENNLFNTVLNVIFFLGNLKRLENKDKGRPTKTTGR